MFGVSFGCLVPMRGAVGSIMFGTRAIGEVLGILQGGPIAAGVIGPFVMGMIFDLNGNYSAAIWGLIVISALMVPLSLAMASPAELAKRIEQAADLTQAAEKDLYASLRLNRLGRIRGRVACSRSCGFHGHVHGPWAPRLWILLSSLQEFSANC